MQNDVIVSAMRKHIQDHPADAEALLVELAGALHEIDMHDQGNTTEDTAARLLTMQYAPCTKRTLNVFERQKLLDQLRGAICCQAADGDHQRASTILRSVLQDPSHPLARDKILIDLLSNSLVHQPIVLAVEWVAVVAKAERVVRIISARDGQLLRPVMPASACLDQDTMCTMLNTQLVLDASHPLCCVRTAAWLLARMWSGAPLHTSMRRAAAALMRAYAYYAAGKHKQAAKDVRVALVYGPRGAPSAGYPCTWALAWALQAHILQHSNHDGLVQAALSMARALECPEDLPINKIIPDSQRAAWHATLQQLGACIPASAAAALEKGGAAGLQLYVDKAAQEALPFFLRTQPALEEFAHYNEWMRGRIVRQLGDATPGKVVDALLKMEAVDLDLLLQGAERGDGRLLKQRVLAIEDGALGVAQPVLELTWEEVCEIKGGWRGLLEGGGEK